MRYIRLTGTKEERVDVKIDILHAWKNIRHTVCEANGLQNCEYSRAKPGGGRRFMQTDRIEQVAIEDPTPVQLEVWEALEVIERQLMALRK